MTNTKQEGTLKQNLIWMKAILAAGPTGLNFDQWCTVAQGMSESMNHANSQKPRHPSEIIEEMIKAGLVTEHQGRFKPRKSLLGFAIHEMKNNK